MNSLFRFLIHSNSSFRIAQDPYLLDFLNSLHPSYSLPSHFTLANTLLDAEMARVDTETIQQLKGCRTLTLLIDGWEDKLRRSLYGTVIAGVGEYPVILGLDDMSGKRGSADKLVELAEQSLQKMEVNHQTLFGLTTDDPSVMRAFRRQFQVKYPWVIVSFYIISRCIQLIMFNRPSLAFCII